MNLMNILTAALAAVIAVIIAFVSGAYVGSHFYCPRAYVSEAESMEPEDMRLETMEPVVPKRRGKFIRKRAENGSDSLIYPALRESEGSTSADTSLPDAERQKQTDAERQKQTDAERQKRTDAERQKQADAEKQKQSDAERQRQFEEDLKAFEACMNYSAERAYDMLKGFNVE